MTKYPVILVHGIALKDFRFLRAFGAIENVLKAEGHTVYTGKTDGFGTVENNAVQLKAQITRILIKHGAEKVNIIAHSKGGLDAKYMIKFLGMEQRVASLTTLCTPHKGAQLASLILRLPLAVKKFIAFWVDLCYRIFGDKHPDSLAVCNQLKAYNSNENTSGFSDNVYCQSYSTAMERGRDDLIMSVPFMITKRLESAKSDGLVSEESSKFGEYKGAAADGSISHSEIVDFMVKKKKRSRIYGFYIRLCSDLADRGF
ncbi:MAG: hypothetical protein K2L42_01360 [Clostridia bacterium]|nr:hypothetical protein [Clostridia bacterium]